MNLFYSKGLVELARYVAPDTLFAFDLDGTLAPIVADFAEARIAEPMRCTLERLAGLASVSVITGRSRKDALAMLGFAPHLVIGNHGLEWPPEAQGRNWQLVQQNLLWRSQLTSELFYLPGVEIEFKSESLSVHYRKAEDPETALARIHEAVAGLAPKPRLLAGKKVVNLLPMGGCTKGGALLAAMQRTGARRAVFFGDDVTDEEVFRLTEVDVFGVHIGEGDQTAAPYYLDHQSEVLGLLNSVVGILESQRDETGKNDRSG